MALHQETSSHWGTYRVTVSEDHQRIEDVRAHSDDPDASPAIGNVKESHRHTSRVVRPSIRRRWLERGPGPDPQRGGDDDEFVEVPWDDALDLLAKELGRIRTDFGNRSIFGGSYGWASAGRLHHAQSQLHRFLNSIGGYVSSVDDYSRGASKVLLPHLIGAPAAEDLRSKPVSWTDIAEHTDLLVSFGGLRRSNMWVVPGGHARHRGADLSRRAADRTNMVILTAQRDDVASDLGTEWIGVRPGTDTALMLALIHQLLVDGSVDEDFLSRYTCGSGAVREYIRGDLDGVPTTPEWAEQITGVPAGSIRDLARRMATGRTLVNVAYALQRAPHGEQAVFAGLTLAAFLGQIGLPGGGFTHGFGSMGDYGTGVAGSTLPTFPQGKNPVEEFIPCARISDMLLHPGKDIRYNGGKLRLPRIRLAYWAGGNPFHHHQDLRRLRHGLGGLDTLVVHETHWTATAKHADIVLPAASSLERDDIAAGAGDLRLRASPRAVEPYGESREEFWIYDQLARRLGADFSEGLDAHQWLERIYTEWRARPGSPEAPPFVDFWRAGGVDLPQEAYRDTVFTDFRRDPEDHPLHTPSGRIELYSQDLEDMRLPDVVPHAAWTGAERPENHEGAGPDAEAFDLVLLCNQPSHRLHSQLDMGAASRSTKVADREPIRLNPQDAAVRELADGDVALVSSAQGRLLAGVVVSDDLLPGVAQMSTGAWFDPSAPEIADCIHGNVNVLTRDIGTSTLTQACSGAQVRVAITRYDGPLPAVRAHEPPRLRREGVSVASGRT